MNREPTYDSAARNNPLVESLRELVHFKDLLVMLVDLSLTVRYKRSLLGIAWTLLNPLLHTLVLTVAFSTLFGDRLPRYPVYVLVGLMVYEFFGQTTTFAMNQLTWGSGLLSRAYLPPEVFPLSAVGTSVVNFALSLVPLFAVMLLTRNPFSWALLFLPVPVLLLALLSLGLGLALAALALSFHDVINMWGVLLRMWYFLTPVMYPQNIIPANMSWLLDVNPLHHILICVREPLYLGRLPGAHHLLAATLWSLGSLILGWWTFSRRRFDFALQA